MLRKVIPNLMVEDVNKTVDYYENKLGCFELVATDPEEGELDWAMMRSENIEIMFQSSNSMSEVIPEFAGKKSGGTFVVYVEVRDIMELYNMVKGHVDIIKDLHTTPYDMREFFVKDMNGYILVFAQS